MKKSKKIIPFLILFLDVFVFGQQSNMSGVPTEDQVQKLITAAWKEPIVNVDILYYKHYTKTPEPAEQIRKRAEEIADKELGGRSISELKPYEIERRNKNIEINFKSWLKDQIFPRKIKEHVWISGENQRIDYTQAGSDEPLDMNTPFAHTLVNSRDANGKLTSYHYSKEMKTVFIGSNKWKKKTVGEFAAIPIAGALRAFLGKNQDSAPISPNYIPDPNKMAGLTRTGLVFINSAKGEKPVVNVISIFSDPNAPGSKDTIEIGDPNLLPTAILVCDRNDYSRVYSAEFHNPVTNQLIYTRKCDDFDPNGFPHKITETKYDAKEQLLEKSVYQILQVNPNSAIPSNIFKFRLPEGYKVSTEGQGNS
jgi:hypothetical protein